MRGKGGEGIQKWELFHGRRKEMVEKEEVEEEEEEEREKRKDGR